MSDNILLLSDSYKVSHWKQYPPNTTNVYSYFESRGSDGRALLGADYTVFFGLQYILKRYLEGAVVSYAKIQEADEIYSKHFSSPALFNAKGWERLIIKHNGHLPVRIKAVPEGTKVPLGNVLMTIENTDPEFSWLTNYLETLLSQVWYPTTVATLSNYARWYILESLERTGTPELIDFKLHDFGFRGVSSVESAGIGGGAHLVNFQGTDTVAALTWLRDWYGADVAGYSVPASEHSTMTSWGKEHEIDAFRNMVERYGDQPFYSVVSDSYDLWEATRTWGGALKDRVLHAKGTLVIRPDSGPPHKIVPELLDLLGELFGFEENEKGFRVLNPKVRVIQGDGMDLLSIASTLEAMRKARWSTDNITFGMGGGLLQKVNRDTLKFAFKASSVVVDGEQRDVFKTPVTDIGKQSKRGRLDLFRFMDWSIKTLPEGSITAGGESLLRTVFEDGRLTINQHLSGIRMRALTERVAYARV